MTSPAMVTVPAAGSTWPVKPLGANEPELLGRADEERRVRRCRATLPPLVTNPPPDRRPAPRSGARGTSDGVHPALRAPKRRAFLATQTSTTPAFDRGRGCSGAPTRASPPPPTHATPADTCRRTRDQRNVSLSPAVVARIESSPFLPERCDRARIRRQNVGSVPYHGTSVVRQRRAPCARAGIPTTRMSTVTKTRPDWHTADHKVGTCGSKSASCGGIPVKSLQGERIGTTRNHAPKASTATAGSASSTRTPASCSPLAENREAVVRDGDLAADGEAIVTLPDGSVARDDAALSKWLGRARAPARGARRSCRHLRERTGWRSRTRTQRSGSRGPDRPARSTTPSRRASRSSRKGRSVDWDRRRFRANVVLSGVGEEALVGARVRHRRRRARRAQADRSLRDGDAPATGRHRSRPRRVAHDPCASATATSAIGALVARRRGTGHGRRRARSDQLISGARPSTGRPCRRAVHREGRAPVRR